MLGSGILKRKKLLFNSAFLDAEVIVAFVLNTTREYILSHPEIILTSSQIGRFTSLIQQRSYYEPVSQLVGRKEFYGLDFFVTKDVLTPRPVTELMVEEILRIAAEYYNGKNITIADIGTGCGCIAVALASHLKHARIHAVDFSKKALAVAHKNAKKHKAKIHWYRGDVLTPLKNQTIDIIAANLPYLWRGQKSSRNPILAHEPAQALYSQNKGLNHYARLFKQMKKYNLYPSFAVLELQPSQRYAISRFTKTYLPHYTAAFKKDLAGKTRFAVLQESKNWGLNLKMNYSATSCEEFFD